MIEKFIFNFSITNSGKDNEILQNNRNIFGRTVSFITIIMIVIFKHNCGVKIYVLTRPRFPLCQAFANIRHYHDIYKKKSFYETLVFKRMLTGLPLSDFVTLRSYLIIPSEFICDYEIEISNWNVFSINIS